MTRGRAKSRWMQRHVTDPYVRQAQVHGYRSRAAFKLQQIAARDRLFGPGMTVVDIGSAPGGWSQVVAAAVAPRGRVIAVDRARMEPLAGVTFVCGDFRDEGTFGEVTRLLREVRADLVLSDMSPNISGIPSVDQAGAVALAELALHFAVNHLKPQGNFLVKTFHGEGFDDFVRCLGQHFGRVVVRKPGASRSESREVYLLGKGFKAG
jgi:23S rRNA (uridine2552-2'-O)-methyltransferase